MKREVASLIVNRGVQEKRRLQETFSKRNEELTKQHEAVKNALADQRQKVNFVDSSYLEIKRLHFKIHRPAKSLKRTPKYVLPVTVSCPSSIRRSMEQAAAETPTTTSLSMSHIKPARWIRKKQVFDKDFKISILTKQKNKQNHKFQIQCCEKTIQSYT